MDTYRWKLSEALQCSSDPIVLFRAALSLLGDFLKVDRIVHVHKEGESLEIEHEYLAGAASLRGRYASGDLPSCISTRKTIVENVAKDPDLTEADRTFLAKAGIASFATVAVPSRGDWACALSVHSRVPRVWSSDDVALVVETAERTWDVVLRMVAEQQLRTDALRDAYLLRLTDTLQELHDEGAMRDAAMRALGEFLRVERAMCCDITGMLVTIHPEYLRDVPSVAGTFPVAGFGIEIASIQSGRPVTVEDVVTDPRVSEEERLRHHAFDVRGILAAGSIIVHSRFPRRWTADDISIVEATGRRLKIAIERATRRRAGNEKDAVLASIAHEILESIDLALRIEASELKQRQLRIDHLTRLVKNLAASAIPTGAQPSSAVTAKRRILIVDDSREVVNTVAMLVGLLGGDAHVAYDGESALAVARAVIPEVVLLDIAMPGLDGYSVCRDLRAELGRHVRIVAHTGWGQAVDRRRAREAGFDLHLVKPASGDTLRHALFD